MADDTLAQIAASLQRIADRLEALAPSAEPAVPVLGPENAYHWDAADNRLMPVPKVARVPFGLLKGIDSVRDTLLANTLQFARGYAANNALLWGARGMGKSSLVKAVHAEVSGHIADRLILVEISREDIESLPRLMRMIAREPARFIVFCDDLSFDKDETSYKSLKAILDGGLEGRPDNALFYATSNRRHMMPRDMIDNERATAINPGEAIEEKIETTKREIYTSLTPWQRVQVARHPKRPYALDYIQALFTDFQELHGDRQFNDDRALFGGTAFFEGRPVMLIAQQKGRDARENDDDGHQELQEGRENDAFLSFPEALGRQRSLDDVLIEAPVRDVHDPQPAKEHRQPRQIVVVRVVGREDHRELAGKLGDERVEAGG